MSFTDILTKIFSGFSGEAISGAIEGVQHRVEEATRRVIKASALYLILLIGILFALIGLANYLQDYYRWTDGLGFVVVGLSLIILGLLAKALK